MLTLILALCSLQDPNYETLILEPGRRADAIVATDMNGDDRPDLIIQSGRDVHVYLYDRSRGFTPKPQHTVRLGGTVFLWTFARLDGRKLPTLFTAGARAIQALPFDGSRFGAPQDVVVHPSLFEALSTRAQPPAELDFMRDLDGDGRSDALLFQRDSIFLMKQKEGGSFTCLQKLAIPIEVTVGVPWAPHMKLNETASLPVLAFGDTNGDGRTDLSYYRNESMGIYEQNPDGGFSKAEARDLTLKKKKRRNRFFKFELPPWVSDFNKDGLLDIAVAHCSKGRVHIYYGREGRTDFTIPDEVMRVADGWSTGIYVEDMNGDGRTDLVMGVIRKFGISEGIEVFLSGKVDIELHLYPMQASGTFIKDPVQELKFSIPYALQVTRTNATVDLTFRPNFKGDFNGDGRKDMLVGGDANSLLIFPGVDGKLIAGDAGGTIRMNPPEGTTNTRPFVADFNGDGVSDLVLKHIKAGQKEHVLELKLSR